MVFVMVTGSQRRRQETKVGKEEMALYLLSSIYQLLPPCKRITPEFRVVKGENDDIDYAFKGLTTYYGRVDLTHPIRTDTFWKSNIDKWYREWRTNRFHR